MCLFSYKMEHDTGFAPNPYGKTLTLATCKSYMRRTKREVGYWIAGFTSKALRGHEVGQEQLIYLMHVVEKLPLCKYYGDARFQDKIPKNDMDDPGDNIYEPLRDGAERVEDFDQIKNPNHKPEHKADDIGGKYVLIAGEFYYFGKNALDLPEDCRPKVPTSGTLYGWQTEASHAQCFIDFVRDKCKNKSGVHSEPHITSKDGGCGSNC